MGNCVSRETGLEKEEDLNDKLERMRINIMLMKLKNAQTYHGDENQVESSQLNKALRETKSKNTPQIKEELRITPRPIENRVIMTKQNEKMIVGSKNTPNFSEPCKVALHQPHFVLPFYSSCSYCSTCTPYMYNCCQKEKQSNFPHKFSETNTQDKQESQAADDKLSTNSLYEDKKIEKLENILTQSENFEILYKKKEKFDFSQQIEKLESIISQSENLHILTKKKEKLDFSQQIEKLENIISNSEKLEILKKKKEKLDFSQQVEKLENTLIQSEKLEILQKKYENLGITFTLTQSEKLEILKIKQEKLDFPQKVEKLDNILSQSEKIEILKNKQEKLDFSQQVEQIENILSHSEKLEILQKNQEKLEFSSKKADTIVLTQSEKLEILHKIQQASKIIPKNLDNMKISMQKTEEYQIILPKKETYKKQTSKEIFELPVHKDDKFDNSCEKQNDKNFIILPKEVHEDKNYIILPEKVPEDKKFLILPKEVSEDKNFMNLPKEVPEDKNFLIHPKEVPEEKNFLILTKEVPEDKNFLILSKEVPEDKNFLILPNQENSQPIEENFESHKNVKSKLPVQNIPSAQLTDKTENEGNHENLNKSQRSHLNDSIIYNRKTSLNIDETFMYHNENPSEIKYLNYNTFTPQTNLINELNEKDTIKSSETQKNKNFVLDTVNQDVETPRYSKTASQRFNVRTFETEDKQKEETPRENEWQRKDTDSIMRIDPILTEERESGRKTETARPNLDEPQFVTRLSLNNLNKKRFVFPKKTNNQEVVKIRPLEES